MKNNQPITDNEVILNDGKEIISTTDLKGAITSYNDEFLTISGFSPEELNGANHNIVRHPDMPSAAFADLWQNIKRHNHWMGIVKNRCKNGGFYWVDAYVTSIFENGQIVGYESVRVKPSPEQIERAQYLYRAINNGDKPKLGGIFQQLSLSNRSIIANAVSLLIAGAISFASQNMLGNLAYLAGGIIGIGLVYASNKWALSPLTQAVKVANKEVNNPLMALIYTGRADEIGQIQLPKMMLQAKMRTILGRINDASTRISQLAQHSASSSHEINQALSSQVNETEAVAAAITEMTASVGEVANTAIQASSIAADANSHSQEGALHASSAADGLHKMTSSVNNIADVVSKLAEDTKNIDSILSVIQSVAEQTNLLALNAAIEAARAGEHGRGFAVVADEVRTLASRTQESTEEIQNLITKLNTAVETAVSVLDNSQKSASDSENQIIKAIDSLKGIATQIHSINDMNALIATAVDEQASVSNEVSGNVNQISLKSTQALQGASEAKNSATELANQARDLQSMLARFRK